MKCGIGGIRMKDCYFLSVFELPGLLALVTTVRVHTHTSDMYTFTHTAVVAKQIST